MMKIACLVAVFALCWSLPGQAQVLVEVPDTASCECEIRVQLWRTIGDPDGRAGLADPRALARTPEGGYLVVPSIRQGALLLFDSTGSYVRQVGRSGPGPWEYQAILGLQSGPGDSTFVLDAGNRRVTVLDAESQPVRSIPMPVLSGQFAVLADGNVVLMGGINRGPEPPDRVSVVGVDGTVLRTLMPQPPLSPTTTVLDARRRIDVSRTGTIAAAHFADYAVEIWDVEGDHEMTLVRRAAWFPGEKQAEVERDIGRDSPRPSLEAVRIEQDGRLWTLSRIGDEDWADAVTSVPGQAGRTSFGVWPVNQNQYWDSVLEVLDIGSGTLLASIRVDPSMLMLLDGGFAISYREDEVGNPYIDVWRIELVVP